MARPKSEDKRNAILAAAIPVIAEQGVGAPTAKIAQLAGVAEGTLPGRTAPHTLEGTSSMAVPRQATTTRSRFHTPRARRQMKWR